MESKLEKGSKISVMGKDGFEEALVVEDVDVAEHFGKVQKDLRIGEVLFTGTRLAQSGAEVEEDKVYRIKIN